MGWAFLSNRLPAEQTDEGRDAGSFLSVAAAACPDALEFHTQKPAGRKKPSPGGEGGPAQAGPDEVEGSNFVPTYGDHRSLRPHQSQLTLRQLPLQGKPLLCPISCSVDFNYSGIVDWRAGHAAAPTLKNDTASRPSSDCPDGQPPPPTRREVVPQKTPPPGGRHLPGGGAGHGGYP